MIKYLRGKVVFSLMKLKLLELEDMPWFPKMLRDQQLGYIGWLVSFLNLYQPIPKALSAWAKDAHQKHLYDLCSGSGEPVVSLFNVLHSIQTARLTDKFPASPQSLPKPIIYDQGSVDVLQLEYRPDHLYTMFNAFHHFESVDQQKIVSRIVSKEAPFFFVEILSPNFLTLLKVIMANTIGQLLLTPFVKPFSVKRLILTYIIPVNLFTITYDGIISVLKAKNKKEYQTLLQGISNDKYEVNVFNLRAPFYNQLTIIRGKSVK